MSKSYFFSVLEKRLLEYEEAIFGNRKMQGMKQQRVSALLYNIQKLKTIDSQNNLFDSAFWGYGINNICDGKEEYAHHDVEVIKRIEGLNKHHESYRKLLLLTFKVEDDSLFVSTFSIDSLQVGINSNINTKYNLKDFDNARMQIRQAAIFVEFHFKNLEKPIRFQVDTYHFGGYNLSREQLAKYYIDKIKELAKEVKSDESKISDINKKVNSLDHEINKIESSLRDIIANTLIKCMGKEDFESLLTGEVKRQVKSCIREYVSIHPNMKETDFISLKDSIQFCNIDHLKKLVLKEENWQYFKLIFKEKEKVNKYFEQFNTLRKAAMHNRKVSELVSLEGKAAMEWFGMIIKK